MRPLLLGTGWMCVGLGIFGIVMPVFPTTPFLLVAVWAFSKSSPEMAERIRNHALVGRLVRDWEAEGVIAPSAKAMALAVMAGVFVLLHFTGGLPVWAEAAVAAVLLATAGFILSRPGRRSRS